MPVLVDHGGSAPSASAPPKPSVDAVLTTPVHEGGGDAWTRFTGASIAIGHYLRQMHEGKITPDSGWEAICGYNAAMLRPPWPLERFRAETNRLLARIGCAMLVRTSFLEGVGRHERLFAPHPPAWVFQFTERVPMHRGRLLERGSTATAYAWVVWTYAAELPRLVWIPPCRRRLERPGDYRELAIGWALENREPDEVAS